ncbi:GumC family protein [Echinicola sp. 20G]|uniref:GumC family protein n=1 Tax=Echinicola sp. 20G TaxID=2781961 RepID=UPI0019108CE0|nr:polysaccharide biosynthesis tyrosine autokinase [Echinicola sp. 20G]
MSNNEFEYYKEDGSETFDFKELVLKYVKYWPYIIASIFLSIGAAYFYNLHQPSEYKIEGKVLIEAGESGEILNLTGLSSGRTSILTNKMANQAHHLKSRTLANQVLDNLDFDVEYYREGIFKDDELYIALPVKIDVDWDHSQITENKFEISWKDKSSFTLSYDETEFIQYTPGQERLTKVEIGDTPAKAYKFNEWVETPYGKFKVSSVNVDKPGSLKVMFRNRSSLLAQYIGENLTIAPMDALSSILSVSIITNVPEKGRDYLNALFDAFLENGLREKNMQARKTVDFIDRQISGVSDTLSDIETKLQTFRSNNRTYNIGTEGNSIFQKISTLETELSQEEFKNEYYKNLESYLNTESYSDIILPSGIGIEDPILNRLLQDLILLQSQRSQYLATQTTNSPAVKEVSRKINDANASINEVLVNIISNSDLKVADLQGRLSNLEREFRRLPTTEQDLLKIQRSFTLNENIYNFLMQRRAEAAIAMVSNTAPDEIMEKAVPSYLPQKLKPLTTYIIGIALGFILPLIVISVIIFTSVKIKNKKELEAKLNNPILTSIGHNNASKSLVVFNKNKSAIAESFRSLRTNLTFVVPNDRNITIAVTSTIAGEGKSFTSMNLAAAYAISDKKTILIGCDLHKPKLFDDFNLNNTKGLSTFLSKQVEDVNSVIQKSQYPNLDLMLAGPTPPNPAELLINNRFKSMLDNLKDIYDVIILDTPPIGLTSETLSILRQTDVNLCVVRYNYSKLSFINDINYLKDGKGFKNVYTVFNDVSSKELSYGGYGYGYYSDDKKKSNVISKMFRGSSGRAAV